MSNRRKKRSPSHLKRNLLIIVFSLLALLLTIFLTGLARDRQESDLEQKMIEQANRQMAEGEQDDEDEDDGDVIEAITESTTKFMNDDELNIPVDDTDGATEPGNEDNTVDDTTIQDTAATSPEVEKILSEMTLEQKVYQMFMVLPETLTGASRVVRAGDATKAAIKKYPVCGICYLANNLQDPEQTKEMLSNSQKYAMEIEGMPLFLTLDEEGGRVARIAGNPKFGVTKIGPMMEISDKNEAYKAGFTIGSYLKDLGFNMDLAPDADVLTNPSNGVIGDRSFGSDPNRVTECSVAYSNGLHASGVMSTFKHFPGHGATTADSHKGYAYTDKTMNQLMAAELVPFRAAESSGVEFVMIAHISIPNAIGEDTPCTLSKKAIDVLRNDFGYNGIIITDSMDMGAIANDYPSGDAAVKAVQAGNDIILEPENFPAATEAVINAVKNGTIPEERINQSVRRIIKAKLELMNN